MYLVEVRRRPEVRRRLDPGKIATVVSRGRERAYGDGVRRLSPSEVATV